MKKSNFSCGPIEIMDDNERTGLNIYLKEI